MKQIKHIYRRLWQLALLIAMTGSVTSCIDYNDVTQPVNIKVQLLNPDILPKGNLGGHTVTLAINNKVLTATSDPDGIASFTDLTPDVYDISTSWELSEAEYAAQVGDGNAPEGCTIAGSLNSQMISNNETIKINTTLSINHNLVIGKVYFAGSRDNNNKSYMAGKYIELYNQSDKTINVSGLYIGTTESESTPAYTLDDLHESFADSVILLKQIYRIPTDTVYELAPGKTLIITNSAVNHTANDSMESDLSDADFEVKDVKGKYQNNPSTPALDMIYQQYTGTSVFILPQSGPAGVVIFTTNENVENWPKVYKKGRTSGSQWVLCPVKYVIDGMEDLTNKTTGVDVATKRLPSTIDAGYTYINSTSGWNGEVVYRKTNKTTADGRKILTDTNNSSNDFKVSTKIKPRKYDD